MKIQQILATKGSHVVTIHPWQLIRDAVAILYRHRIGALVVIDEAAQPVGLLSERDILWAAAGNESLFDLRVRELMTREIICGDPESDIEAVAHTMTERRIRHIPVMEEGALVGIISIGDVVKAQRDAYQGALYTLETMMIEVPLA